jgi:hypothetical protein
MELARNLKALWQRRRLVLVGAALAFVVALLSVYQVGLLPPSLSSRTNVFATASTEILVDTPDSAFADLGNDLDPLDARASVFARFMATPTAVELIAREAKLPATAIEAQGPYDINQPLYEQEPTAEQRSSQIVGEGAVYRMRFENNPNIPIISVFAQAPTEAEAKALAAAAPTALRRYVEGIQARQDTPEDDQVVITRLGRATGGVVNESANMQIATLVFVAIMIGWCMLLIPAQTIARGWRQLEAEESGGSNGFGDAGHQPRRAGGQAAQPRAGRERVH